MKLTPGEVGERHVRSTVTFASTSGTVTVFTITGRVFLKKITAYVTADVVENGVVTAIELGVASDPNLLIVATNPEDLDADEWWVDATPLGGGAQVDALQQDVLLSESIILTITGGTDLTSGSIVFDAWYKPITDNGALA